MHQILVPELTKMDQVIRLCRDHAIYEKSDFDIDGKIESLSSALSSEFPPLYIKVASISGNYIGYISWMIQYSTWDAKWYIYMDCLYIDEAYRGKGIGEALIIDMCGFARDKDIDLVQWQTPSFNERAIKFYKRLGAFSKSKERFFLNVNNIEN